MGVTVPLLTVVLVAATVVAGPIELEDSCSSTCTGGRKLSFETGIKYEYDYVVKTHTDEMEKPGESVGLSTRAKATISVISPCEFLLELSEVTVAGTSNDAAEFTQGLTQFPLKFGFDDGRVTDICVNPNEEIWATNIKRGIMSMFQNTMEDLHQNQVLTDVDITGECDTRYSEITGTASDTITIRREKSFGTCRQLAMSSQSFLPAPFHKSALLTSNEICKQKIEGGVIQEVHCEQNLLSNLSPVSRTEAVSTTVKSTIKLIKTDGIARRSVISDFKLYKSSLQFDESLYIAKKYHASQVETILNELDGEMESDTESDNISNIFSQLVEIVRHLSKSEIKNTYEKNKFDESKRRLLVDAAMMVATPDSTSVLADLILKREMSSQEADHWFTSMSFITKPEYGMFVELPKVLEMNHSKKAMFGISTLVNTYCKINEDCIERESIREIIRILEQNLGYGCRSVSVEEKGKILLTLKTLSNAGQLLTPSTVEGCFMDTDNPLDIRVAAVESWRRLPCSHDRSSLISAFFNILEDSEVRIQAYLSMISCPTNDITTIIKDRLLSESVDQVGSFIWSHLTNLRGHGNKPWLDELVGDNSLINKFDSSLLKLSRHYNTSLYSSEEGIGASSERDVIFSSNSWLPRSGMINLNINLFGESVNLFEIGGRIEGAETLVEKFFGPNGYYPEGTVQNLIKNLKASSSGQGSNDEEEGSYYVKILGNYIHYHHFRGIENLFNGNSEFNLMEMIAELTQSGSAEHKRSYQFLDTELYYPTIAGMPVILKFDASSTIGLKMDGKFNVESMQDMEIEGHIAASATAQIYSSMLVDAHVSIFGRKIKSNVHSSLNLNGGIRIENNKLIDVSVKMAEGDTEILDFTSEHVMIENGIERRNTEKGDADDAMLDILTYFGADLRHSSNYGPGLIRERIYLMKTDSHKSYDLRLERDSGKLSFLFDTPGSMIPRKHSFTLAKSEEGFMGELEIPHHRLTLMGRCVGHENGKKYVLELKSGDMTRIIYQIEADFWNKNNAHLYSDNDLHDMSLKRSKRSFEDERTTILSNFNSLYVTIKTPFEAAREVTLSIEKTDGGDLKFNYKRGNYFIDVISSQTEGNNKIEINSSIPGFKVRGGGTYSVNEAAINYDITTPYSGYEALNFILNYDVSNSEFQAELKSINNDFEMAFTISKPAILLLIHIPNEIEPTKIVASLALFDGEFKITSRFASIRTFEMNYKIELSENIEASMEIKHNDEEIFSLEYEREEDSIEYDLKWRRGSEISTLSYERTGFEEMKFVFNNNNRGEYKIEAKGSGELPSKGTVDFVITNSYRQSPRTREGKISVDRTSSTKKYSFELAGDRDFNRDRVFAVEVTYKFSSENPATGKFSFSGRTPYGRNKSISGSWDLTDLNKAAVVFSVLDTTVKIKGMLGIKKTQLVIDGNFLPSPIGLNYNVEQWETINDVHTYTYNIEVKYDGKTYSVESFGKIKLWEYYVGRETYNMDGVITKVTESWQWDDNGIRANATTNAADINFSWFLHKFNIIPEKRMLVLNYEFTSGLELFTIDLEVSLDNEFVIKFENKHDSEINTVLIDIRDVSNVLTEHIAKISFFRYIDIDLTFGHDFRESEKKFTISGTINEMETYLKTKWRFTSSYQKFMGSMEAKTFFFGDAKAVAKYDVREIEKAYAELKYTRNDDKYINLRWSNNFKSNLSDLKSNILFESHFENIPRVHIRFSALLAEVQAKLTVETGTDAYPTTKSKLDIEVLLNNIEIKFTRPLPGYEDISIVIIQDFSQFWKFVLSVHYQRGDKEVKFDFLLHMPSSQGKLTIDLTTPFRVLKTVSVKADWDNGVGKLHYKRNEVEYNFDFTTVSTRDELKIELSSTPENAQPIKFGLAFRPVNFVLGTGTRPVDLIGFELEAMGERADFTLTGLRNPDRFMLKTSVSSTFGDPFDFKLSIDTEITEQLMNGQYEMRFNEHYAKFKNQLKFLIGDGFDFSIEVDSSLTDLPGVLIGLERKREDYSLKIGTSLYDLVSISVSPEDFLDAGFSGKLDLSQLIPTLLIDFDVDYSFASDDVIKINISCSLSDDSPSNFSIEIVYDSDGVRGRLF